MMRQRAIGHDAGLSTRMFLVMALLGVLYLGFIAVLWAIGLSFVFIIVIAAVMLGIQYFFSDKIALAAMRAKIVSPEQAPKLHATIEKLAMMAGLPKPRVAIVETDIPNAFATGRSPKNSVVAVTTGIMDRLTEAELEGVLAHELSHIRNRDVMVITLASFFATVASLIMQNFFFMGMMGGMGRGRDRDSGSALLLVWVVSIAVYFISFILIRMLSRYRELAADRSGAIITGAPSQLGSALIKIAGTMQRVPQQDLRRVESMNAFFIIPALSGESLMNLFSTHPPLEQRIERLRRLSQEIERA
jgi:heat shock protein HtpX